MRLVPKVPAGRLGQIEFLGGQEFVEQPPEFEEPWACARRRRGPARISLIISGKLLAGGIRMKIASDVPDRPRGERAAVWPGSLLPLGKTGSVVQ